MSSTCTSMASHILVLSVICTTLTLFHASYGEKILLFPFSPIFNSRTMNMEKIAVLLQDNGHSVSMLVSDHYRPSLNITGISLIWYKMPELWINKGGELDLNTALSFIDRDPILLLRETDIMEYALCDVLFGDQDLIQNLKAENFSLYFFDFVNYGPGIFLNEYLQIPSIAYHNYGFWNSWWVFRQPVFYSFMPYHLSSLSDHMTFWERLQNIYGHLDATQLMDDKIEKLESLRHKYFPRENWPHMSHAFEHVSLVVAANVNFALDYPRPVMPHVKPISGLLWTPTKRLPEVFHNLMSGASEGVILVSFGTLVPTMPEAKAETLSKVFAKLSQRVIWRYKGTPPKSLGNNTYLVDWFPQNDLLAHNATKLFITHCGVSSTWETLYHAVPVIAIPLLFDQYHHATKLTDRAKIGVRIPFSSLSESTLETAISSVLGNNTFKENAVKFAELLKDTPMTGQEELLFWVDYVIRHNGTLHFHSQAAYSLNWYQYYLLDVIAYRIIVKCLPFFLFSFLGVFVWKSLSKIFSIFQKKKSSKEL